MKERQIFLFNNLMVEKSFQVRFQIHHSIHGPQNYGPFIETAHSTNKAPLKLLVGEESGSSKWGLFMKNPNH